MLCARALCFPGGRAAALISHRPGSLLKALRREVKAVATDVLADPAAGLRVVHARDSPAQRGCEAWYIAAAEYLADADRQVGSGPDPVRDNGKRSACHRLVDDEAPGLSFARQNENVGGMVIGRKIRLVDEAGNDSVARIQGASDLLGQ